MHKNQVMMSHVMVHCLRLISQGLMYKFSDISESEVPGGDEKMGKGRGCYVSAATGIVITLLAIAIAVGVGLIVHFAENRKLECNFPDVHIDGVGKIQPQTGDRQTEQPDTPKPTQKPRVTAGAQSKSTAAIAVSSASATPCPTLPSTSGPSTTSKAPPTLKDVRLPTALKPTHYILKLTPHMYGNDPSKFTFEGHVKIEMNCSEPTSNVTLHINQLNVSSPRFASTSDDHSPRYVSHTEDKERQFLIIHLDKQTTGGQTYFLEMKFVGPLKDDLKGLYLSTYKNAGKTVYAAATQFEPTDARKAFPCFDEPQLKATFEVTLVRKNTLKSISNMPKTNSVPFGNNMVEDHYRASAVMSTYLLAFIVGNFEFTAANTSNGLLYRAWSIPDSVEQTHTALDVGIKTIVNYEKYFGITFPLPKQDMIAIPDFAAGAMENWGLITYRETAMLFQPGVSSERNLQRVTTVITHELGHQWFGDLVTMRWWDDLWLNEGFATFVECMGADFIHPDWKMYEQFVVDEVHDVLDFDGLVTSHPIYVPVNNPDEINEIFDRISYAKGGSVIRMMRFVLGDETFRKGIQLYLTRRQYQNAFHDDLWQALTNQSTVDGHPVNVKEVMDTWILQMNYPVVSVTAKNNKVNIQQSRFLSAPDANDPGKYTSPFGYKWRIPFTYTTSTSSSFNTTRTDIHWLNEKSLDINQAGVQDEDWILGNIQQYGFYRVTYEDSNWMALVAQLKRNHERIHVINRAQLINDAWSLARASQLSTNIALSTLEYLNKELEYVPWVAAQRQLSYLDSMLSKTDMYGQFESFMKAILADPFKHYGMDDSNSTHIETYIRSEIVNLACSYGITECITKAKQLFEQWMKNPTNNPIDPDLRDTVYCTAIAEGSQEEWDFAFDQFKLAEVASEKATLMKALACSKSTWILSRYLNIAITPTEVRKQDATKVLVYISENSVGQALAWDFVRSNWNYLLNEYGKGVFSFTKLIAGLTSSFNTEFQLTQLNDFLAKNPYMGTGTRAFQQAKEKTQTNIKWMTQNKQIVAYWLKTVQTSNVKARATDVRLPQHLIPYTYDVTLQPNMYSGDPADFTFDGYVKIYMDANETGSNVTIHTNKLTIDEASIKFGREDGVTGGPVYTGERSHDDERQFEIFALDKEVTVGDKYYIEMNFTGPLIGDLAGLYLSQYQRGNNTVYIATTQMEATDARKAFPCFDEPEIKASFNVKLVRKRHMKSISNMPIIGNETLANDFVVDIYNTSAKMSTYLIAFIVCDFEYTEDTTAKGIKYRAWARPESVDQTNVALAAGVKIIDYYEDYFGIDYPLPKQDMIAIPDFAAGAMENWGLITYRETAMLYEDGVSSESNLQRVNVVIAHELAHQWFGDLVTMDWWDDLWLNEGFATFVEYMGVDHLHPDYKMFEQFVFDIYEVFEIDSLVTSHPIYVPVANPEEINEIFDSISYAKGGSVLRMMRFFLGEKVFQEGVQIYLKNREYANANHNDLWAGLEQAARKANQTTDVQGIMDTWILQMNYPVIKVTRSSSGQIQIEQKRFLTNPDAIDPGKYPSPFNYTWKVPFTYTTKTNPNFNQTSNDVIWLEGKQKELPGTYPAPGDWILGNIQEYGIYRVNYEESNWGMLNKQLKDDHNVIGVINRAQIINDAFGLAKAEQLSMDIALQTLEYLQDEEEYIPWVAAGSELNYIDTMLSESSIYGLFEKFMKAKVEKQFGRLGLNNTGSDHLTTYIRSSIASKACGYGNDKCTTEANRLYREYMTTKINPIDPNLKSTVYCTALRTGGEEEWQFAFDLYKSATVAAEKSRLLSALSCTREPWLLYRLLDLTLQPDVIRKQDAYKVYVNVGSNKVGTLVGWNFFREKWDRIFQEYGTGSFSLSNIIKGVTATFNTEFLLQQMKTFKAEHPDMGSGTRAYSQAIENVEANILWMNKNYQTVKDWLERTTNA